MALGVCRPCIGMCHAHVDTCSQVGEAAGAWQRVEAPTEPISTAFDRSTSNESDRGVGFSNRSTEAPNLDFESYGSTGHVNIVVETFSDAWGRVATLKAANPPPNSRSASEEFDGGPACSNRSSKASYLGFERCGGARGVKIVTGTFSGVWRRIAAPMAVFPLYNDRSGDDLFVGGGLYPRRCLECRFRRSWWLGRAWAT